MCISIYVYVQVCVILGMPYHFLWDKISLMSGDQQLGQVDKLANEQHWSSSLCTFRNQTRVSYHSFFHGVLNVISRDQTCILLFTEQAHSWLLWSGWSPLIHVSGCLVIYLGAIRRCVLVAGGLPLGDFRSHSGLRVFFLDCCQQICM